MLDLESPPGLCDVIRTPITAESMNVVAGTVDSGVVDDTRVWSGNFVSISEVTGVPGIDVRFTFINVKNFCFIGASAFYVSANNNHYVQFQLYDDANTTWKTLYTFSPANSFDYRFSDVPVPPANIHDFINPGKEVIARYYHPVTGAGTHDFFIDYMALIG